MRSIVISLFVFVGIFVCLMYYLITKVEHVDKSYHVWVGENITMGNDTLEIVDYSLWSSTLTLSNGVEVSLDYVQNQKMR